MQNSVILITTGTISGTRSAQRTASVLYGAALSHVGLTGVLYTGGDPAVLAQMFDWLLLSVGWDLSPALYGCPTLYKETSCDIDRDFEELALIRAFCTNQKPILGICRGIQAINVFFGGTLFQDILGHRNTSHLVGTVPGTYTASLTGNFFKTNSYHHQAIDQLGQDLDAAAYSKDDGIVEAIEHRTLPILGVQWHPERMISGLCSDTPADHTGLFAYFTQRIHKT